MKLDSLKKNDDKRVVIIYFIVSLLGLVLIRLGLGNESIGIMVLGGFAFCELIATCFLIRYLGKTWINFLSLFLAFLYLFHIGQLFLNVFSPKYKFTILDLYNLVGYEKYISALYYSMVIIVFFSIGAIASLFCLKGKFEAKDNNAFEVVKMRRIGIFVTITTLPVHAYISFIQIVAARGGDYFDAFEVSVSGIISAYIQFLVVGLTLLMMSYKENKKVFCGIYLLIVAYYCWTMLSGGRGKAVITIVYFTYLFVRGFKFSIKHFLVLIVFGYLGLSMLVSIKELRTVGNMTVGAILGHMFDTDQNGFSVVQKTMEEFGATLWTVVLTQEQVPKERAFMCGSTYLKSMGSLLPTIGSKMAEMNEEANYVLGLNTPYIGGSIIGELYYNFGKLACFFSLCIGVIIASISKCIESLLENGIDFKIAFYSLFYVNSMWWIRDTFLSVGRAVVWSIIYLVILDFVYKKIEKKDFNLLELIKRK